MIEPFAAWADTRIEIITENRPVCWQILYNQRFDRAFLIRLLGKGMKRYSSASNDIRLSQRKLTRDFIATNLLLCTT